jgi:hypothetical protein
VPEVALELVGLAGISREHPAKENVLFPVPGVLEESLSQVNVIAPDALGDVAPRADALEEIDAGRAGWNRARDVRFSQADGGLEARRRRKAGEERRLRRIGSGLQVPVLPGQPHFAEVSLTRLEAN